jgi:Tfp pilus assembly protein PilF
MKKYSSYQKTAAVYFSGESVFPIGLILIASAITYGLYYFLGMGIALFFNVLISWCFHFYLYFYGKNSVRITFDFLKGFVLILTFLLFVDYGVYTLVVYQKTGMYNELYFQLWLSILVGIPTVYNVFKYGRYYFAEWRMAANYLKVSLKIHYDRELLTYIDTVQFANTSKRTMSDIKLEKAPCFYSEEELKKMEDNCTRNYYLEKSVFSDTIHLPFGANKLFMSWYSIVEDKYYDIELPFPFEKMILEREKYPTNVSGILRGKKTKRLNLHIHSNGGIRLFNTDTVLIDHLDSIPTSITEEVRNEKIKRHRYSHEYYNDPKAFSNLTKKIKTSGGIAERFLIQNKLVPWSMTLSGLEGNNYLDVFDVSFHEYESEKETLETSMLRFLPKKLEIVYRGDYLYRWLILRINTQKLYQCIQKLTNENEESPVSFDLVFNKSSKTDLKFTLSANGKSMVFTCWEIQIDKARKQSMDDHLLDKNEDETKQMLLKEAWALVGNKQYALAQEKCDAILTIDPRYGYAYFLESRLLWYKEGFEACYAKRNYFISKTKHEPSALAHIYNNYGCLLDEELRYEESKSYFEKAIESYPKEGMYVCNLAEMYCKLKDPRKAMEFAEKSKTLGHESETLNMILESKGTYDFTKTFVK